STTQTRQGRLSGMCKNASVSSTTCSTGALFGAVVLRRAGGAAERIEPPTSLRMGRDEGMSDAPCPGSSGPLGKSESSEGANDPGNASELIENRLDGGSEASGEAERR